MSGLLCGDCGLPIAAAEALIVADVTGCPACAAARALAILAPDGSDRAGVRDIEEAAAVLHVAAIKLKVARLSKFAGRIGGAR